MRTNRHKVKIVMAFALSMVLFFSFIKVSAQDTTFRNTYWRTASELIFSLGDVEASNGSNEAYEISSYMRFSGFFNLQYQYHWDFSKRFGLMTGFGVRNVGFINNLNDSVKLKQRVYSFGIPLALKVGKLPDNFTLALGVEPELFFHYKQKAFYDDEKYVKMGWFSDRVNLFNPSAFLDIRFKSDLYIRFKYYITDVLVPGKQSIGIGNYELEFNPTTSKMFYIAIGSSITNIEWFKNRSSSPDVYFSKNRN
ncbi:MAG: hypothetical protein ACK5C5_03885 [Bacteroidota bacterium]|jgi:hypothetical protein